MGTIVERKRKDGTVAYRASVRLFDGKTCVFRKEETFDSKSEATKWMKRTEGLKYDKDYRLLASKTPTFSALLMMHFEAAISIRKSHSKRMAQYLAISKAEMFDIEASKLTGNHILEFAKWRRSCGAGPSTVGMDINVISTVLKESHALLGVNVTDDELRKVRPLLHRLELISRTKARKRRPEGLEMDRLLKAFRDRMTRTGSVIPMADCVEFLVYSCLRLAEMTRLKWDDLSLESSTILLRDCKSPTHKQGNDRIVPLLPPALEVIHQQPKDNELIFPYDPRSISAAFTRTCQNLGIKDLHLHDLRREGASRLMEMGFTPAEVATITGHQDISILNKHYTAIRASHVVSKYGILEAEKLAAAG